MEKGLFVAIVQALTMTKEQKQRLVEVVWTTDSNTSDDHLRDAIPEKWRSRAEAFRGPEWCGFGDLMQKEETARREQICWYRFFLMVKDD